MNDLLDALGQGHVYQGGLRSAIPVLLAALGGSLCLRARVFNIALEGKMLLSAFAAVAATWFLHSAVAGVLAALACGALLGLLMGVLTARLAADIIVLGVAINLAALGFTAFALNAVFHVQGAFYDPGLRGLGVVDHPLGWLPGLGTLLERQTPLVFLGLVLVPVTAWVVFRSGWGLRLRAMGDNPVAAAAHGVPLARMETTILMVAGALCGLAGAQLAIGQVHQFSENMTSGRGYIALAAVLLAKTNPWGAAAAALGFGIVDSFGTQLQIVDVPEQLGRILPYVVALAALVVFRRRGTKGIPGMSETT